MVLYGHMKGKLIVVDGGDGAGKQTQVDILIRRLIQEGHQAGTLDFPRYKANSFGKLLRECLDGKRGDFLHIDPRIASTLYAADRFETKSTIDEWLNEGRVVILDRYVTSNMMHQGSKIKDQAELEEFLGWLDNMEHEVFGLPRPDLVLYFKVDPVERIKMLQHASDKKENVLDLAETNLEHQKQTDVTAGLVEKLNNWKGVECMHEGGVRTREDIHEEVYAIVKELINA